MDETNDLSISLGLDPTDLRSGLSDAERIIETSAQRIRSSIERIGNLGQQLAGLGATMTASLTVPIVGLATASIQAYGEIQSLQKGLEAVMGTTERASAEFERLKEVAKLPGLGMQEAVKGSINLQSIGISAEKSRNILQQFGNAVATVGKGRAEFERAIYGVQQLANTDFPLGEDLNIIKDALPQVSNLLKEAFGTSRSDELAKLGITSQQVLDTILNGLGKLPRVTGGIKGAFENLSDSMKTSLGRIGKIIDDAFDISGIVDKITDYVDKIVSAFENLDPAFQKVILGAAGFLAVLGPLLLAVGGFMALIPTLTAGLASIGTLFSALLGPIGLVTVAIIGVVTAVVANWGKIKPYLDETIDRFKRLYKESTIFRIGIQSLGASFEASFKYVGNILDLFYKNFVDFGKAVLNIFSGIGDGIEGTLTFNYKKILAGTAKVFTAPITLIKDATKNSLTGMADLYSITAKTVDKWRKIDLSNLIPKIGGLKGNLGEDIGVDKIIKGLDNTKKGLDKTKKETEKQISEIFPVGSIAQLRQRAELIKKSLETSVGDFVNIRGIDKFGKEVDKKGNPIFTNEILSRENAYKEIEKINAKIDLLKPPEFQAPSTTAFDQFRTDFSFLATSIETDLVKIGNEFFYFPKTIGFGIDKAKVEFERLKKLKEDLNKDFEGLVSSSVAQTLSDTFSSIAETIAQGGNVMKTIGNSLLKGLSSFLKKMGEMLIQYGTLTLIKGKLDIASKIGGPTAIAAGLAAIAIGAAASAIGGAIGSFAASGGNSSSNISSSSGTGSNANFSSTNYSQGGSNGNDVVFRISGNDLIGTINRNISAENRLT